MKQFLLSLVLLAMVGLFLTADLQAAGDSITGTCEVTSPDNAGAGTLRQCLLDAQQGDVITFDTTVFPPSSPTTILLSTELPALTSGNVTVDTSGAGVILDGNNAVDTGLAIQSDDNQIFGLEITRFSMYGIYIDGSNNLIGPGGSVTDCDTGVSISGIGSANNHVWEIGIWGCRIGIRIDPQDPNAEVNGVNNNFIGVEPPTNSPNPNEIGILVASGRNNRIVNSIIGYNGTGIRVEGDATLDSQESWAHNCIEWNTIGFSHAGTAIDLRFERNWWNAGSGPSGVGPGSGDSIEEVGTGTVDYEPWHTLPPCHCLTTLSIFCNRFESGDTCDWSYEVPMPGPPCADFIYSAVGLTVNFQNQSRGTLPLSFSWDFGDATAPSSEQNPIHVYALPGTYNVTLTVTNALGMDSIQKPVTVEQ